MKIKNQTFNFFVLGENGTQIQIITQKDNVLSYSNIYYHCNVDKAIEYIKKYAV